MNLQMNERCFLKRPLALEAKARPFRWALEPRRARRSASRTWCRGERRNLRGAACVETQLPCPALGQGYGQAAPETASRCLAAFEIVIEVGQDGVQRDLPLVRAVPVVDVGLEALTRPIAIKPKPLVQPMQGEFANSLRESNLRNSSAATWGSSRTTRS